MAHHHRYGRIFVISAPSGAGKTTLINRLVEKFGINYSLTKVITFTTRKPRPNEVSGRDYHFLSPDEFAAKQQQHFFLEVTSYNNNLYGSPASVLEEIKAGKSFIFITDSPGARSIKQLVPNACLIWILPPDLAILRQRIVRRGSDSLNEIEQRIAIARHEIQTEKREHFFTYHVINDRFDQAVDDLSAIVIHEIRRPLP